MSRSGASSVNKSTRDLSFKPRFIHNYGYDEKLYEFVLKYKDKWQKSLFFFDEDEVKKEVLNGGLNSRIFETVDINDLKIADPDLEEIDETEASSYFNQSLELVISKGTNKVNHNLQYGAPVALNDIVSRNGLVVNTGGHITSMKWLHTHLGNVHAKSHHLAVSVIFNPTGISDSINHPQLSIYNTKRRDIANLINSAIQIWKYDLESKSLSLEKVYVTTEIGSTANLDWLPIHIGGGGENAPLGILAGTFTDGKFHLFKVQPDHPRASYVKKSSLEYASGSTGSKNDYPNMTTFDFLGHDKVLVGLTDGTVAEYVLPYFPSYSEEDFFTPSYITRVGDSPINVISIAQIEEEEDDYLIYVNTTGVPSLVYTYKNFVQGRAVPQLKTSAKPSINNTLKVFVAITLDTITYYFFRSPHDAGNILLKSEFYFTTTKSSEILGHPLNITGSTGGDIVILNYTRKFLNGSKATSKSLSPLKLWNLSLNEKVLKLSADYVEVPTEATSQNQLTPPEIIISSLAWNENVTGSSVYTAGTISGLLILERLDPKYNK